MTKALAGGSGPRRARYHSGHGGHGGGRLTDRLLIGQYSTQRSLDADLWVLLWSLFSVFGAFTAGTCTSSDGRSVGDEATARNTLNAVMLLATGIGLATMVLQPCRRTGSPTSSPPERTPWRLKASP